MYPKTLFLVLHFSSYLSQDQRRARRESKTKNILAQRANVTGTQKLWPGDPSDFNGDLYAPKPPSYYVSDLLNLRTTENSFKTITHRLSSKETSLERDGTFNSDGWFKKYNVEIPNRAAAQIEQMKRACDSYGKAGAVGLSFYKKIALLLTERNISCVVYIPPLPVPVSEHLLASETRPAFEIWEKEMGCIFPNIVNLARSPHGSLRNFFRSDLEHLTPEASARIINLEVIPMSIKESKKNF